MNKEVASFTIAYTLPLAVVTGYLAGGLFNFLTPVYVFGLVPVLDLIIGVDRSNPPSAQAAKDLEQNIGYRLLTWGCCPVQVALTVWGAYVVAFTPLSFAEVVGLTLSIGICSGAMGITVAHELAHRVNNRFEPLLARIMLATCLYMHWAVEHVVGHHRTVATPEDPASARLGESFYKFWPRTVLGGLNSAWDFEVRRIQKRGRPVLSRHNRVAGYLVCQLALLAGVALIFGLAGLAYWVCQSVIAISLLEIVNYVEHYGLMRTKDRNGCYEPINPRHSWNSSNWLTNRYLFNLQRHSDHHYKPGVRYQALRHFDESPQLPTGYAGMLLLALIPPLWYRVMDPRVQAVASKA